MLKKEEIEKRLKNVDPLLCVAFAVRCSLRVLPLLVLNQDEEDFWYWNSSDRANYVLALFKVQQFSINYSVSSELTYDSAAVDAAAYAVSTARTANASAVSSANAANSATDAVRFAARSARSTAYAADASSYAAHTATVVASAFSATNIYMEPEIRLDLDVIARNHSFLPWRSEEETISYADFVYSPLWQNAAHAEWQALYSRFIKSLIELDAGFKIWVEWYQDRIESVPLNKKLEKKWLNIPGEVMAQGAKACNAYLASLDSSQPLNLVRAIFIGNGAAGKTSLIRKLHDEPIVEGNEKMTPGIQIREWPVPDTEIKARFWDFGGQVMSHSTHQFFLRERCLYILVLDA